MKRVEGSQKASGLRLAIVASRFNEYIVNRLVDAALSEISGAGGDAESTVVVRVPGAFEIPLVAKKLAASGMSIVPTSIGRRNRPRWWSFLIMYLNHPPSP